MRVASFIWGKNRTAAQERAPQIALRNCSKEVGNRQYICDADKGRVHTVKHIFFVESFCWSREVSASHEKLSSL